MPRLILFIFCLFLSLPARAQYSEGERLDTMEKKLNTLERAVYRGDAPSPVAGGGDESMSLSESSSAQVRLTQLEEKIGRLQGQVEELQHQIEQLQNAPAPVAAVPAAPAAPTALTPDWETPSVNPQLANTQVDANANLSNPVEDKYEQAFASLRDKNYPAAIQGFQEFIATYPDHVLASNAYYWLGEAYYAQKDYQQASVQFMQGYQSQPKGNKAPDSLLKLGMALGNLDKKKEACATYNKLLVDYPAASVALRQRASQEQSNLKCN